MAKTKLIIEIEEFFAESKAFCDKKRTSCTLPYACERGKSCEALFGFLYMTDVVNIFTDFALNKRKLLESVDFEQSYLASINPLTKEYELEYFERFSYLVRRAQRSEETLHWLKSNAFLSALEGVE